MNLNSLYGYFDLAQIHHSDGKHDRDVNTEYIIYGQQHEQRTYGDLTAHHEEHYDVHEAAHLCGEHSGGVHGERSEHRLLHDLRVFLSERASGFHIETL